MAAEPVAAKPDGKSWDDLLLAYISEVTPTKRAPERDRWSARTLRPHFTGRPLASIGAEEVRGYIATRKAAGIAPATINREIGLMSAACNWARRELEWDIANPWEARRLKEPAGRDRWLTEAEAAALLAAADARRLRWPWLADFCRLCLYAGLRPGEALGLEWARVDLGRGLVRFDVGDQKSGKRGAIPINQVARAALIERARFRAEHCPGSPWVFCRRDGSRIASIKKGFASLAQAAGLVDLHPHDLRRTFGSWLVQQGIGIERVAELLRHGDVAITARVYAHLRPSDLAEAASALDRPQYRTSHANFTLAHTDTGGTKKPAGAG